MIQPPPSTIHQRALWWLLLAALATTFCLFRPFLVALVLAWITAAITRPLQVVYLKWLRGRNGAATAASLVTVILVVMVPFVLMALLLVREGLDFIRYAQGNLDRWIRLILDFTQTLGTKFPFLHLERIELNSLLPQAVDQGLKLSMATLNSVTQEAARFAFQSAVFLFCLYYFLLDWRRFADWIEQLSPFAPRYNHRFFAEFMSMGRSVLKSTLVLGALQGVLGGIALAVVGVPSPIFWGVVMIFLSLLPAVGSALVLLPAGLVVALAGRPLAGIGLMLFSAIVVSNVDNLLRPKLVGRETALHPLAVFLSTLGGLALFGFSGFILGPVAIALVTSLLRVYREELRPLWMGTGGEPGAPAV